MAFLEHICAVESDSAASARHRDWRAALARLCPAPAGNAKDIFCGARQAQTRVEVRGFARPDCADPNLQKAWKLDFSSATVTDGEPVSKDVRESRQELHKAYGRELSGEELERGGRGEMAIPRCRSRGAPPAGPERTHDRRDNGH
jgi:hypothetical protein